MRAFGLRFFHGAIMIAGLTALVVCAGCAKKIDKTLCLDANNQPITGPDGQIIKSGTEACTWVLQELEGHLPCRTDDGFVIYDQIAHPFHGDDGFCAQARAILRQKGIMPARIGH